MLLPDLLRFVVKLGARDDVAYLAREAGPAGVYLEVVGDVGAMGSGDGGRFLGARLHGGGDAWSFGGGGSGGGERL